MEEDKITTAIEGFNTKLLVLINECIMLGQSKVYAKSKVLDLCNEANKELEDLQAPTQLINQTIESLKLQFMRSWIMSIRELKKIQKNDELGVIGKTIQAMESNEPLEMRGNKGITIDILEDKKQVGVATAEITNLRDFMTDDGLRSLGAGQRYVDYVDRVNESLVDINEKLANGTLSTIGADGRKISVRNLAEIDSRYRLISDSLERATADGNKFVVASAHADCSERCSFWQGKIYLVDLDINSRPMGQYKGGVPSQKILGYIDGKPYYSLLEACNNGFLSFNCQHRLIKYYNGIEPPQYDMMRVKFMRSRTERQRVLENRIRMYKRREKLSVNGATVKRKNPFTGKVEEMNELKYNQLMSTYWQEEYSRFSKRNGLPEYRWRLKITEYEGK